MSDTTDNSQRLQNIEVTVAKIETLIDTKLDSVEKRVGRIEMVFLAIFAAAVVVVFYQMANGAGVPLP